MTASIVLFIIDLITSFRHPYDNYDRIWHPNNFIPAITRKEQSLAVNTSDHPPKEVLLSAVTNPLGLFSLSFPRLPEYEVPIYINMYFAEVDKEAVTSPSKNRSFLLSKDLTFLSSEPIVPSYENVTELTFPNITANSETKFLFIPTPDSAYPPILNAFEIFLVSDSLTNGTNGGDGEYSIS